MKKSPFERVERMKEAYKYPGTYWENGLLHSKNGGVIREARTGKSIRDEAKKNWFEDQGFKPRKKKKKKRGYRSRRRH